MGYRVSVSIGVVGAVIVAVSLTPSLAGQAQTGAATDRGLTKAQQEETRKLIHDVAEGLKAKQAAGELAAAPKELEAGADAVGRSGSVRRLHEQRRERHSVREAGGVRGTQARGHYAGRARENPADSPRADAGARRVALGRAESAALLVGDVECEEQPRVARAGPARWPGAACDCRKGSSAHRRVPKRGGRADMVRPTPTRTAASTTSAFRAVCQGR